MRARWVVIFCLIIVVVIASLTFILGKKEIPQPQAIVVATSSHSVIGKSVQNRNIEAYIFGNGEKKLIFAGGMHGGYEWNSVLLAYEFIDYFKKNSDLIPKNISLTIIPVINPDGLYSVIGKEGKFSISDAPPKDDGTGKGRFNANEVDLNRNFDCKWKSESTWRKKVVSAGTKAFSEPESLAIKNYVIENKPLGVIFWHSQSNAVYASECNNGILPVTLDIMNAYSKASGYPAVSTFDAYPVSGDSEGWLASIGIPAITVELKTHETIEWEKNLAGMKAILEYYAK